MNTQETFIRSRGHQRLGLILSIILSLMLFSGSVLASTAADHIIRNTVSVDYDNGAGVGQTPITAFVDVTVNLVPASPLLSAPTNLTTDPASGAVYSYTLTATANGPDTYNMSAVVGAEIGILGSTTTIATPLILGATTVAADIALPADGGGSAVITVPSDSNNADSSVNGLVVNDIVVIGTEVYSITAIDDSNGGTANSTSTITVVAATGTVAQSVLTGDIIGERVTFTTTVTPGTPSASPATIPVTTTVTSATSGTATASHTTTTTVSSITLTVTKYVANITNPVVGGGTPLNVNTGGGAGLINYYASGVTGNPGDTLEYVIQVSNPATSSVAKNVRISDPVPAFTTYTAGTIRLDSGGGAWVGALDADADSDAGEFGGDTVYIYVGTGGTDGLAGVGNGTGGDLAANTTTLGSFRVTIDN